MSAMTLFVKTAASFCLAGFLSVSASAQDLHLYVDKGGDHVYLGCFSCNEYSSDSIWNEFGKYGSEFSSDSIWNAFGSFGSEFSPYSPWNEFSSQSPVLVDRSGNFYGYFTCNRFRSNRVDDNLMDLMCKYRDDIRKNRSRWYGAIIR